MVYVELDMGRPVRVVHVDYMILPFGRDGRLDERALRRGDRLIVEAALERSFRVTEPVVEFAPHLARMQYRSEFQWKPTREQARRVLDVAIGR
jgi:hypothetical protein